MKLVFATNNQHKISEIRRAINPSYEIIGLSECGIIEDIPETGDTLEKNAIEKAMYIFRKYSLNCFADDTGLEVESLGNRPGVYSSRYAGPECNYLNNIHKLLKEMEGILNRKACFKTVIAYIEKGSLHTFHGTIEGTITDMMLGENGFGYDSVFKPLHSDITFAQMPLEMKNSISHRALALREFCIYLSEKTK